MELEIILPPSAENISPIFITSPCNHSGGALLQRSICRSQNGFCYGDNLFDEVQTLIDWAFQLLNRHQEAKEREQKLLNQAMAGETQIWMPELAMPHETYMASLLSVIYNLPHTAQHYAQQQGRDVWMMARAGVPSDRMVDLLAVFPSSKSIFIHRNPLDVVRDALRDRPDTNINDICSLWNDMMRNYLTTKSDRLLKLCYEDALIHQDEFVTAVEDFTGVKGLQGNITNAGIEAELDSTLELSENQVSQVKNQCEDMLAVFYPELTP